MGRRLGILISHGAAGSAREHSMKVKGINWLVTCTLHALRSI
jgi:hypothetical protein